MTIRRSALCRLERPPSPVKQISLLVPIWGSKYVRRFLDLSLPTLLASGNLPALAAQAPCTLVFLTSADDVDELSNVEMLKDLSRHCRVDFVLIDDLIAPDNHSTTLTLAYARAVRSLGSAMVDTCYFFLVGDYIVADGSLANAFARIKAGASGVLSGNFQVISSDEPKWITDTLDEPGVTRTRVRAIPPRSLIRAALPYIHPATAANIVNSSLAHTDVCNRLFWRVDKHTVVGRFYLMHMICIRPETSDFRVGSSCDYSFIPEMCPFGNVAVMTDSDDFLVVEMQPVDHEASYIHLGPVDPVITSRNLSRWTTARHRENAHYSVIFHGYDIPVSINASISEADRFIATIERSLKKQPKPHRNHPYWLGAIAAFIRGRPERRLPADLEGIVERSALATLLKAGPIPTLYLLRSYPPRWLPRLGIPRWPWPDFWVQMATGPWRRLWPDHRAETAAIENLGIDSAYRVLCITYQRTLLTEWLERTYTTVRVTQLESILSMEPSALVQKLAIHDACVVIAPTSGVQKVAELTDRIAALVKDGGQVLLVIENISPSIDARDFSDYIARHCELFARSEVRLIRMSVVKSSALANWTNGALVILSNVIRKLRWFALPIALILGPILLFVRVLSNFTRNASEDIRVVNGCSSVLLQMRVDHAYKMYGTTSVAAAPSEVLGRQIIRPDILA